MTALCLHQQESKWNHILETAAKKTLLLVKIKMVTLDLFELACEHIKLEKEVDINDTEKQLDEVGTLMELGHRSTALESNELEILFPGCSLHQGQDVHAGPCCCTDKAVSRKSRKGRKGTWQKRASWSTSTRSRRIKVSCNPQNTISWKFTSSLNIFDRFTINLI